MSELHSLIREYTIEAAELDEMEISLDQDLVELGLDSLAGLEITVNLEKKYQIKVPPARYEEMVTIQAIANLVTELLDAKETETA
ncbi:MAG: acyl carrier protein [Cognaticolwellia sp.]|jgi:acyl carrier protein